MLYCCVLILFITYALAYRETNWQLCPVGYLRPRCPNHLFEFCCRSRGCCKNINKVRYVLATANGKGVPRTTVLINARTIYMNTAVEEKDAANTFLSSWSHILYKCSSDSFGPKL